MESKTQFADAIIRNTQGQILLLHRTYGDSFMSGKFGFPGGHIEKNEDPAVAAVRETLEETGLTITVVPLSIKEKDDCVIHYYQGLVTDDNLPQIILDAEEHRGYEWVDIEDVADKELIADLATYVDAELLNKLYPVAIESRTRQLTPEEFTSTLDEQWNIIETAFNNGLVTEEQFFKAKEQYIAAKKKEAFETIKKAYDADIIDDDAYITALVLMKGGDPSHGGKLVKKIITDHNGKLTTKWVDKHTGEEPVKEKKAKVAPTPQWYDSFKKYKLNCYPINIDKSKVDINESGDTDSHWILRWKDPKSGAVKNAYSKEFMDRNAAEKWNRMKNVSSEQIIGIQMQSNAMMRSEMIDQKHREAAAIINIIAHTGLRRGDKLKFDKSGNRGVSSLSPDNITIEGSSVKFNFIGKSYQENNAQIDDSTVAEFLTSLKEKRKGENFLFDTTDAIIDTVFDKVGGEGLKIKDMRTYVAGDIARKVLFEDPSTPPPLPKDISEKEQKKLIQAKLQTCYEKVAEKLNNTPVMAKNSYIHPNIVDYWIKSIGVNFEIKKGSILGAIGDKAIAIIKSVFDNKKENTIPTMDEILRAYPEEIIQETDCIDEEMCDMFNEHEWLNENSIEKSESTDELQKGGKAAFIGEKRMFGGREYVKTINGWKFHGKGTGVKAQEHIAGVQKKS